MNADSIKEPGVEQKPAAREDRVPLKGEDTHVDVATSDPESETDPRLPPLPALPAPRLLSDRTASMASSNSALSSSGSSATTPLGPKRRSWWQRVGLFSSKRKQEEEDELTVDQDMYMRTILESYSSSLSSNRFSSVYYQEGRMSTNAVPMRSISARRAYVDESGGVYVAQPETPNADDAPQRPEDVNFEVPEGREEADDAIMEDEEEKRRRRIQRRITQDAIRKKIELKNQHKARTRKKFTIFALCIGLTLTAFIAAAVLIANAGVNTRTEVTNKRAMNATNANATAPAGTKNGSTPLPTPTKAPTGGLKTPTPVSGGANDDTVGNESSPEIVKRGEPASSGSSDSSSFVVGRINGTLGPITGRSALDLLTSKPPPNATAVNSRMPPKDPEYEVYTYVHCLLMSLSLWLSLVVIGMHITFGSFRKYSMPLVLELSTFQTGYWITSLLRVQMTTPHMSENLSIIFCLCECFFNFGQISFTCAIAFNMYRSVVSYADVLVDTQSANRRYRSYTVNVMLLSFLASITLALVGYRNHDRVVLESFEVCLYPTCRLILYVYYPLLAFAFNFIFYVRFKRTIGGAYPMSATGRLNSVTRSYLVLFFVCWGSLITLTILNSNTDVSMNVLYALQWTFDVLGVGTALITLTNYHRCRRAFDFGLSLKAIDPHSIEFEEPLQILGEGTFAIVLRAKWRQRSLEDSASHTMDVAVKTFKHTQFETLEEMKEEAYLASKLVHPCVMMTYGCYTIGNNLYILSEYLGGGTLQDVIDTTDNLGYERALRYAHMIAMGMRFLHGLPVPIIHRDLKPLNCIFDSNQEMLKIADFGESRLFRKEGMVKKAMFFPSFDLTLQMTTNIGSACWAAPEVLKDEAVSEYSLKVDVYSFGIICWQLFSCDVPYTDIPGSVLAVAEAVIGGRRPEIPSDCPTLFSKIMRRCWHEDPVRRPNFEDIVQLLEMELTDVQNPKNYDEATNTLLKTRSARKLQLTTPKAT